MSAAPAPDLAPASAVRFVGGRYNGLQGTLRWVGDVWAQVIVIYEGKPMELLEELRHMQDLAHWRANRSATELALKSPA